MIPDAKTLNELIQLTWRLHEITGKSCYEIMKALLATRTLSELEHHGDAGHLSQDEAEACVGLLEKWIRQARERSKK